MTQIEIARLKHYGLMDVSTLALVELQEYIALLEKLRNQTRKELTRIRQYTYTERMKVPFS